MIPHQRFVVVLGQVQNRVDIRALMDNRAIFIARLPKGIIGTHTAKLLYMHLMILHLFCGIFS
jgi:hypothetical protein